jgi:hypothetical protein
MSDQKGPTGSNPTREQEDNRMALLGDGQIAKDRALEQGMMIAEVNVAIGAIDRILKLSKDGKSNHRELTNAGAELAHWRARLFANRPQGLAGTHVPRKQKRPEVMRFRPRVLRTSP